MYSIWEYWIETTDGKKIPLVENEYLSVQKAFNNDAIERTYKNSYGEVFKPKQPKPYIIWNDLQVKSYHERRIDKLEYEEVF